MSEPQHFPPGGGGGRRPSSPRPTSPASESSPTRLPWGLCAFALTTFCPRVCSTPAPAAPRLPPLWSGWPTPTGGFIQLLAGMWEMAVGSEIEQQNSAEQRVYIEQICNYRVPACTTQHCISTYSTHNLNMHSIRRTCTHACGSRRSPASGPAPAGSGAPRPYIFRGGKSPDPPPTYTQHLTHRRDMRPPPFRRPLVARNAHRTEAAHPRLAATSQPPPMP